MSKTVALELVPPAMDREGFLIEEEAYKAHRLLAEAGLLSRINTILVPQVVAEDDGRPIALRSRMDPLEVKRAFSETLPYSYILAQVTVHTPPHELQARVTHLLEEGVSRLIFVGAPRNSSHAHSVGPPPDLAIRTFRNEVPSKGVILIPTRMGEDARFRRKLEAGADFAVTQLLFSDHVIRLLKKMGPLQSRPEVILSFGYVPKVETERGLLRWLIRDDKSPHVAEELAAVNQLAALPLELRKHKLVDLYRGVVEQALRLDLSLGVHFECPYGITPQALETFNAMLDIWKPS